MAVEKEEIEKESDWAGEGERGKLVGAIYRESEWEGGI